MEAMAYCARLGYNYPGDLVSGLREFLGERASRASGHEIGKMENGDSIDRTCGSLGGWRVEAIVGGGPSSGRALMELTEYVEIGRDYSGWFSFGSRAH